MITRSDSLLVVSPHLDDEILGTGCMIKYCSEVGADVHIVFMTVGDTYNGFFEKQVSKEERTEEMLSAVGFLHSGFTYEILYLDKDGSLDTIPKVITVTTLDKIFYSRKPTVIAYPYPSHHQDHRYTYEVTVSALRPTPYLTPRLKLVYEYPYVDTWTPFYFPKSSKAYLDSTNYIDCKLRAFSMYESQIQREESDLLHPASVKSFARIRGNECGVSYAEAYYPQTIMLNR